MSFLQPAPPAFDPSQRASLQPAPPPFDLEEWLAKPYLSRLKANCQDWVDVAAMVRRGPWLEESFDFPVEVTHAGSERQPVLA